jgi:hypothetical protein
VAGPEAEARGRAAASEFTILLPRLALSLSTDGVWVQMEKKQQLFSLLPFWGWIRTGPYSSTSPINQSVYRVLVLLRSITKIKYLKKVKTNCNNLDGGVDNTIFSVAHTNHAKFELKAK